MRNGITPQRMQPAPVAPTAPAGVPREVVDKVHLALSEVLTRPDVLKRLDDKSTYNLERYEGGEPAVCWKARKACSPSSAFAWALA